MEDKIFRWLANALLRIARCYLFVWISLDLWTARIFRVESTWETLTKESKDDD
jgi:hypothetical protein